MALSTNLDKARKDVEKTLSDPTPLYVLAGVGDLAVEKARAARNDLAARAVSFDAKAFGDKAQATAEQLQAKIAARVGTLPTDVKGAPEQAQLKASELQAKAEQLQAKIAARVSTLPTDVKGAPEQAQAKATEFQTKAQAKATEFQTKAQTKASDVVTDFVTAALTAYGDLAGRGKVVVTRIRKQQETADLESQVEATVSKAKAAKTTAKKSVKKTASSAKATKTTAKKSAAATKKATKSATTSAKKSVDAAVEATQAAAEKIGD